MNLPQQVNTLIQQNLWLKKTKNVVCIPEAKFFPELIRNCHQQKSDYDAVLKQVRVMGKKISRFQCFFRNGAFYVIISGRYENSIIFMYIER